jgi:hypothetical protein
MSPPPKGATLLPTGFVHWTAPTEAGYFIGMLRDLDPTLIVAVGVMLLSIVAAFFALRTGLEFDLLSGDLLFANIDFKPICLVGWQPALA